ncbi:MAG: chitobiase/beta-hexosaminidase C-terminal domain-containing protein [Paludibacteraceae bacterium]|nr:chitobiase/beta-hexosaminidase C-terminal domain-containing protein [Paludibacteraceae bacterium]
MSYLSKMVREWFENESVMTREHFGSVVSRFCLASLICLCMLTIGVGNAWAETATSDCSTALTTSYADMESGKAIEWKIDAANSYTSPLRIYSGKTVTFHCKAGATKITQIVITANSNAYGTVAKNATWKATGTDAGCSASVSGKVVTITCTGTTTQVTCKPSDQTRWDNVVVTYTPSAASHTLSSAVTPVGSGTVALSSTSVAEGSTATATATPAAHYTFTSWSISGTGSTLSSTTENPTTVTMGTANATVTATFTAVSKASITLSEAGATTTDNTTYYVGDTYTLPTSTSTSCGTKVLVGWSSVEVAETNTKPSSNYYEKGAEVTLAATQTFYAVFATAGGGGAPTAYTAGDEGDFVIASKVGDNWYALPTNPTVSSGKITGVAITVNTSGGIDYVTTANASGYTWTIADATYGQTISDGTKKIYHSNGGVSGTDLTYGNSTTLTWDITYSSPWLTFRGKSSAESSNSRGMLFNGSVFGGYSLGNADESSYYHIRVLPISDGTTYSAYSTSCAAPTQVATPTFSVAAGTYNNAQSVEISCATVGATIHYTIDGTDPTASSPTYSSAISVTSDNITIKAIATKSDMTDSDIASATYRLTCATPSISPAATGFCTSETVTITCATDGASIYYTTNNTAPSTSSTLYTAPFDVTTTSTVRAIAVKSNYTNSSEATSVTYTGPLTVAQALVVADNSVIYVRGIISQIDEVNTTYGNATYWISDDGTTTNQFEIYRGKYLDGVNFTDASQINVGDRVVVYGKKITYGTTKEITNDPANYICSLTSYTITAVSNNVSYGIVSVTGSTITATPESGYRVMAGSSGYTVTAGTATVVNNGDNTFTVTPSTDCTIQINFELIPVYTVGWIANGIDWTGSGHGSPATSAEDGTKPTTIPTAPVSADCDGSKVFVGWTNAEYEDPDDAPAVLFTSQSGAPEIASNTTFYAVFATNGGAGEVLNEEFDNNSTNDSNTPITSSTFANFSGSTNNCYKGAHGDLKMSSGSTNGTITSKSLDLSVSFNITMDVAQYGSDAGSVTITIYDAGDLSTPLESQTISTYGTGKSLDFAAATSTSVIKIAATNRVYIDNVIVTTGSLSDYATTCCQQPATQLSMTADKTELVGTGLIELSLAGGNGEDITWSCRDEADANCDALLSSTSNSGATFTVSSPAATTKTYTVQALQPEKDLDGEGIVCGKRLTIEITVKTQWTITFKTTDESVLTTYSTTTVTDGDTYTFPDLSDDYTCETNYSFAGWKAANTDGAPEYAAGSSATATENTTWYAVWMHSTGTTTITRDKYVRMTNGQSIAANDVVVVAYVGGGVALKQMTEDDEAGSPITVDFSADKSYLTFAPETAVMQLKALWHDDDDDDLDGWLLQDNTADFRLTYAGDKGGTLYYTDESGWFWDITITAQNNAVIEDTETGYDYSLQYNTTRNVFAFYSSSQKMVQLYRKNGTVSIDVPSAPTYSVNNMHCTNGATIRANGGQWITSAKDQKVRITVPVTAKNFETSGKQITGSSDNAHFAVSVASHTIPSDKSESAPINVTIEYTPAEANVIETANITLTTGAGADDATKVIEVNGRSLPDEFVIMTQKESKWQALPADMFSGASTYEPTQVYPNGGLTLIPAAPYTAIYSAREVAASRYEAAGGCMRLVGNNNKCLWANGSNGLTTIQNFAQYGSTNGSNYEWLLYTEDGEQYTIANPAHPEYATGRQLGIYALKYGLYKTSDVFYLLPVGCSNMPGNVQITPRRVDATFSWETNASSVTIDIYTNEAMTEGHQTANVSEVPYLFTGLAERTNYWYKLTPDGNTECAVTGSFSTTGPIIDIVEWQENAAVIFVDKDEAVNPRVVIDGEVEHGQGGVMATNIFFSKYFEAEGYAKMLAIFNGTGNAISLADVTIQQRSTGSGYTPFSLASYGKTAGWIQPGEEIILFNKDSRDGIMKCAVSDPTYPTWNNVENKNLEFGGKGTVRLFKGGKCIDIIGAMAATAEAGDIDNYDKAPLDGTDQPSWGDKPGFTVSTGDDYNTHDVIENDYGLSTNRCLLIRQNWVTSGDSAVLNNYGDFKTLGTYTDANSKTHKGEWAGLQVPDASGGEEEYIHTCEGFQEVGKFDYNKYYKEYNNITDDKLLSQFSKDDEGNYIIPFDYMRQYACLNLKFQLTRATADPDDEEDVLTEQIVQVPIVVKTAKSTNDTLFNHIVKESQPAGDPLEDESIERCKTCNVVILGTGTLTKAADGATGDVPQMGNLKIYPGGKLVVPSSTNFTVNSLAFRRQEDEVSMANIQGGLTINHENSVFLDVRIDPSSWHYIALPNNCRVGDITWADGTPAKVNADYLLAWYDGEKRATDKKGGWTSITDNEFILKTGIGYIVALPGSGNIKRELRFPMGNDLIEAEDDNKAITELHAWGGNNDELRPNHKGWNMIGNPYLLTYNNTAGSTGTIMTDPLVVGKLVEYPNVANWDGSWVYDPTSVSENLRYIVAPIDNGWSGYTQTTINDMKPFTSYFVQIGGAEPTANRTVTFKAAGVPRSVIRRAPQEYGEEDNHPVFYGIELTAPNNEKDRTALLISNDFTDDYDMMDDLAKQRGDYYKYYPYPVLASRNNEGEMAFNALPDTSAATVGVPLNYYAAQAGTHTIATDFRYDLEEVKSAMLYDATNNTYTDLLTQNYEFTAAKGENTNRFTLYVRVERKKAPNPETDMDNILDGKLSLITIGKTLVLSGLTGAADVYVYDMSGKLLSRDQAGNGIWRTTVPATGVYFVRVDSANGQQTLRSIVK